MWLFVALAALAAESAFPPGSWVVVPAEAWLRLSPSEDAPGFRQPDRGPGVLRVIRAEGADWLYVETRGAGWGEHCQRTSWPVNGPLTLRLYVRSSEPLSVLSARVTLPDLQVTAEPGTVVSGDGLLVDGWTLPVRPPPGHTQRWYMVAGGARSLPGPSTVISELDADALHLQLGGADVHGTARQVWYRRPVAGEATGWLRTRCVSMPTAPLPESMTAGLGMGGMAGGLALLDGRSEPDVPPDTPLVWPDGRPAGHVRSPWHMKDPVVTDGLVCRDLLVTQPAAVPAGAPFPPPALAELSCPGQEPCASPQVCFPATALSATTGVRRLTVGEPTQANHVRTEAWMGALSLHDHGLQDCATDAWARRPETAGEVLISLVTDADGAVTRAIVLRDGTNDPELAVCLRDAASQLRVPTDGAPASLTQRFVLPPR